MNIRLYYLSSTRSHIIDAKEELVHTDDGIDLWTATSGTGPPVVLCHGGPGSWVYLGPVAEMIDDTFTVHRYDQRGTARSSHVGPYTVERFVGDLECIREHFGHDTWVVGGHSWGASLALYYAFAHPARTRALVYIAGTGLDWKRWRATYHTEEKSRWSEEEKDRYYQLKEAQRTPEEKLEYNILNDIPNYARRDEARGHAERVVKEMLRYDVNYETNRLLGKEVAALEAGLLEQRCRSLEIPVLIIHPAEDPRPIDAIRSLSVALPMATMQVIPGAGHMPWVEQPKAVSESLRSFLQSPSVGHPSRPPTQP